MHTNKEKLSALWQVVFSFLVVSKVLYYFEFVAGAFYQGGLWTMGEALLTRLLTQDILIILIILLTFNTEKFVTLLISKYNRTVNQVIVHVIDYVLYMVILALYFWIMILLDFSQSMDWRVFFIYSSTVYVAIVMALETKKHLKKKEMTAYTHALNTDEKLAMLKALLDNSVLTQEEYDRMVEKENAS